MVKVTIQITTNKSMWALIGGAIIAAMTIAGGIYQNRQNQKAQERQNILDQANAINMANYQNQLTTENWEKTNAYNAPAQQMTRLRQAGLNPAMMYGGKGAGQTADTLGGPNIQAPNHPAPKTDLSFLGDAGERFFSTQQMMANIKNTEANTDNLHENKVLMGKEGALKDANTLKILGETKGIKLDYDIKNEIKDNIIRKSLLENQNLEADLKKKAADTQFTLDANERAKVQLELQKNATEANMRKIAQDIMTQRIQNAKTEQERTNLQKAYEKLSNDVEWDKMLRQAGVTPGGGVVQNAASIFTKLWDNILD